ncbi:MAG: recombinase family protein [Planctomycetes bacterium]|nr:recombinase family protein [Planctomycetota bacterium]
MIRYTIRWKRRGSRRSKEEIEAERRRLQEEVEKAIDEVVAEMHASLPRHRAKSVGVAYARYSTEFQHSIGDQIRGIFESAIKLGIFIPREHIFYDLAVPGCKERRPGLDQVRAVLARNAARVLLVFTTNRLFRKNYKCMKFVEEEIVGKGLRCIFVRTGIDTDESDRWRLPLQMHAIVDEMTSTMYAENIRAAHEGLFINGYVVSTLPFGFTGKDVPGQLTKRQRVRQLIVIDENLAVWVRQIFQWFVEDRLPMARILERLNVQKVPCGPKSDGSFWSPQALHYLLTNTCYRGWFMYGKGKNVWQGKADYSKRVLRDKPLREKQFEELRIVSDEMWHEAQRILASSPQRNAGRKPKDGNTEKRPRILNGLLLCKKHQKPLKVSGSFGQNMCCMRCVHLPVEERYLFTFLNRAVALRCICRAVAEAIRSDTNLIRELVDPFLKDAEDLQKGDTGSLDSRRTRLAKTNRQIEFILDNPGETEEDRAESKQRLSHLRTERSQQAAEIAQLLETIERPRRVPTEDEFRDLLKHLEEILLDAANGPSPADAGSFRQLLELLTGGKIMVEQMGEKRAYGGWLRVHIPIRLLSVTAHRFHLTPPRGDEEVHNIEVDIRDESIAKQHVDEIMKLYDAGMLVTMIADKLGIDRRQVTDAVKIWHEQNGKPLPPDGRSRRASLPDRLLDPPVFQVIANEVKELYDQELLIDEIAERVGRNRDTVRSALRYWFKIHNEPMPDMRNRRKTLPRKNRPKPTTD